jgi:hypothetical protein
MQPCKGFVAAAYLCTVQVADSPFASVKLLVDDFGRRFCIPKAWRTAAQARVAAVVSAATGRDIACASPLERAQATMGSTLIGKCDTLCA